MNFEWQNNPNGSLTLFGDETRLATYDFGSARSPFLHPIWTVSGRGPLSNFAPFDHRWHRGVWWSWKYLDGLNFWEDNGDEGFGESVVTAHELNGESLRQSLELRPVGQTTVLLHEIRMLTPRKVEGWLTAWALDWHLEWRSTRTIEATVTPFPEPIWGGYAGLNFRPARVLGWNERVLTSNGETDPAQAHGQTAQWAAYAGALDGDPQLGDWADATGGAAFLIHPQNARFPSPIYLASSGADNRGFGFLSAAPLMLQPFRFLPGESLQLAFRAVFFEGAPDALRLQSAWDDFARLQPQFGF